MNKDSRIAKKTVQTEIQALKKLLGFFGNSSQFSKAVNLISKMKIYRSLNAQINSTNMGMHNIRKYKNIDSLIINASELRHELRDREGDLKILGIKLCFNSNPSKFKLLR